MHDYFPHPWLIQRLLARCFAAETWPKFGVVCLETAFMYINWNLFQTDFRLCKKFVVRTVVSVANLYQKLFLRFYHMDFTTVCNNVIEAKPHSLIFLFNHYIVNQDTKHEQRRNKLNGADHFLVTMFLLTRISCHASLPFLPLSTFPKTIVDHSSSTAVTFLPPSTNIWAKKGRRIVPHAVWAPYSIPEPAAWSCHQQTLGSRTPPTLAHLRGRKPQVQVRNWKHSVAEEPLRSASR